MGIEGTITGRFYDRPKIEIGHFFIVTMKGRFALPRAVEAEQVTVGEKGWLWFFDKAGELVECFGPDEWASFTNR